MSETEHRQPLDLSAVRRRFALFCRYEDAAGSELAAGEHAAAIAAAWDVELLLAEITELRGTVDRVRALADKLDAESPKPGPGGFIAEGIYDALGADRAAAGGGRDSADGPGAPMEHRPPPTPTGCGRPGCRESEDGYELVASTEPCPQCQEVDR